MSRYAVVRPHIDAFLDELRAGQARWTKELHLTKTQARQAYDLLHWADRLSLILCRQELPEMGREVEISALPPGHQLHASYVSQLAGPGSPAVVRPWPFAGKELEVSVEGQELHQLCNFRMMPSPGHRAAPSAHCHTALDTTGGVGYFFGQFSGKNSWQPYCKLAANPWRTFLRSRLLPPEKEAVGQTYSPGTFRFPL